MTSSHVGIDIRAMMRQQAGSMFADSLGKNRVRTISSSRAAIRAAMVSLLLFGNAGADNPLVERVGMADPNVRLMDGTFYVWATHDLSVNNTGFRMLDWWVWSSADLVKWTLESRVKPRDVFKWDTEPSECWATDAALHNGTCT